MPSVEEALGRPATDFKTYVEKTVESGAWNLGVKKKYLHFLRFALSGSTQTKFYFFTLFTTVNTT
ncbi:MAG: hypothetical protein V3U78_02590 [Thiotrichaceae bacterium]